MALIDTKRGKKKKHHRGRVKRSRPVESKLSEDLRSLLASRWRTPNQSFSLAARLWSSASEQPADKTTQKYKIMRKDAVTLRYRCRKELTVTRFSSEIYFMNVVFLLFLLPEQTKSDNTY